jgi:hypothetical protein
LATGRLVSFLNKEDNTVLAGLKEVLPFTSQHLNRKGQLRGVGRDRSKEVYNEALRKSLLNSGSLICPQNEDNHSFLPHRIEYAYVSILKTGKCQMSERNDDSVITFLRKNA